MAYLGKTSAPFAAAPGETPPLADFETTLKQRLREGWTVKSDGPSGVQLVKPKKMRPLDTVALVLGAVCLFLMPALGLFLFAVVAFDYFLMTPAPKTEFLVRPK